MAITWSTEIYTNDVPNPCPTCANTQYQTGVFLGKTFKRCIECGRVSPVSEADNLVLNE